MDEAHVREQRVRSLQELAAQITELAGHLNAAHYRWFSLIAEFDRRQGWSDGSTQSCAHWLNWQCGIDMGAAREKVRVAHEGRVVVQVLDDGALRFVRPNGESFQSVAPDHTRPLSDWRQLPQDHGQQGIHIDKNTAVTRWRGERMDYGLAIDVLLQHARRGARVSAETHRR